MEGQSRARFKVCLSAKNLCLGQILDEIRQIHSFFYIFSKVTDSFMKSARTRWPAAGTSPTPQLCIPLVNCAIRCLANRNAPVGGHPGPEEIENCGNDGQTMMAGNQRFWHLSGALLTKNVALTLRTQQVLAEERLCEGGRVLWLANPFA